MSAASPKIKAILLCDDIRIEDNGKHMLIGIYSSDISVGNLPSKGTFKAAIVIDAPESGDFDFHFRLIDHSDKSEMHTELGLTMFSPGSNIVIPGFNFGMDISGRTTLEIMHKDNEEWVSLGLWELKPSEDEPEDGGDATP